MKTPQQRSNPWYIVLAVLIQIVISNFVYTGPYINVTLLPFIVLTMPMGWSTVKVMTIATVSALPVDFFAEGVAGLNMAALLLSVIVWEIFANAFTANGQREREGIMSIEWLGRWRYLLLTVSVLTVFLIIHTVLECAGTRPASFIALKITLSCLVNTPLYFLLQAVLLKKHKK